MLTQGSRHDVTVRRRPHGAEPVLELLRGAAAQREHLRSLAARAYEVLDDASLKADLSTITSLAAHLTGARVASVNLVDDDVLHQVQTRGAEPRDLSRSSALCERVLQEGRTLHTADASLDDRWRDNPWVNGESGDVRLYASAPLRSPGGHVVGTVCVLDDEPRQLTTEQLGALGLLADQVVALLEARRRSRALELALETLDQAAHVDALTGLANRASAVRALRRITAHGGWGLLFFDVNDFKGINDLFGHDAGDRALVEVAQRLQAALRPHDLLVRWAGDEFVALLADVHEQAEVDAAAARLQAAVAAPYSHAGSALELSVSVGGQLVAPDDDAAEVMRAADLQMYEDKRRRKQRL